MQVEFRQAARRGSGSFVLVFVAALVASWAAPVGAGEASFNDPDDVALRLDLKSVSHANDGATVTYTAETYEGFPDSDAAFKWRIDRDGDGVFEVNAFAEWDLGALVGGVEAGGGDVQLAPATVSRPAPNAIRVTFPVSVFAGSTSYGYVVIAETDVNNDGETDPGEFDRAPDAGVIHHTLAVAVAPETAQENPAPAQEPPEAPARTTAAAPQRPAPPTPAVGRAAGGAKTNAPALPPTGGPAVALVAVLGGGLTVLGVRLSTRGKKKGGK